MDNPNPLGAVASKFEKQLPKIDPGIQPAAKTSLERLKGALGDETIGSSSACLARALEKKDYGGPCPICGQDHQIANTADSQELAARLKHSLDTTGFGPGKPGSLLDEKGNMIGVLVCIDENGKEVILKAFSGELGKTGLSDLPGWSPPIPPIDAEADKLVTDAFNEAEKDLAAFNEAANRIVGDKTHVKQLQAAVKTLQLEAGKLNKEVKKLENEVAYQKKRADEATKQLQELADQAKTAKEEEIGALREQAEEAQKKYDDAVGKGKTALGQIPKAKELAQAATNEAAKAEELVKNAPAELEAAKSKVRDEFKTTLSEKPKELQDQIKRKRDELTKVRDDASDKLKKLMASNRLVPTFKDAPLPDKLVPPTFENVVVNPDHKHHPQSGSCAAPKLLQEAKNKNLTPVSMTEFWYGGGGGSKITGDIVPSCEFCRAFVGFTLCGVKEKQEALKSKLDK
jgi:DNA repair exonuclease SbcCD ATPase subunit